MNYIFGTNKQVETLKTVGNEHSDLAGFVEVKRHYPDCDITDRFRVVRKTKTGEDTEGNCYNWYDIDNHYRYIDKTEPLREIQASTDNLIIDQEYRLALLEMGVN